ncbi:MULTISPECIES: fimbria/pilus outer membrane usher protein [Deefgea]|uniref:Fimbrial biogenesis outer membrane usher protein n=1 Tax=Deefgea chitinilytica TaxID=570276 RepID=A0ABS2CDF3_9NEIS|nr:MULTISPECIES: fimbria/pilus outer membrane usher protein [Deefgea]MBM5572150.1 hypothetical protein [Deefgea chitinilytica]MBM9889385.1 fimbrial biogenesis outer membrane usher protein [Deefgea sp. CFH1-16]
MKLSVNGVPQGDVPAIYDQGGYWLKESTIQEAGINTLKGELQVFAGESFFRVDRLVGIESKIDTATLTLSLTAAATEFGERQINLNNNRNPLYPEPAPFSWYLNYQVAALSAVDSNGLDYQFNPTLNLNQGPWNFRSAHFYSTQNNQQQWARLNTTLDYDRPDQMLRASAGDISPSTGALGFSQNMAGLSISRVFNMQPNFMSSPSFNTQAAVTQPSTAEIYLNGQRVSTQSLQPGIYSFGNLNLVSGLQNIEIVIRDAAGNTQRINVPHYFDDSLLKAGLTDFNYSAGIERENASFDRYDGFTYSLYQRIGITDWFTLGAQASGNPQRNSGGILANFGLSTYGTLASAFAWAQHEQQSTGDAQLMQYRYINQSISLSATARRQDKNFFKHNSVITAPDWSANIGMGWGNSQFGNLSIDVGRQMGQTDALTFNRYQLSYAVSPIKQLSFSIQGQLQDRHSGQTWSGFVNLAWFFDQNRSISTSARYENSQVLAGMSFGQNSSTGEGWAYNFGAQQQRDGEEYTAWIQNKRQHGQINLSAMRNQNTRATTNNWQAAWSGALAYAGGHYALTRPISQSFAVIELPQIENVAATHNGSEVGRTSAEGTVFVPELASYGLHQIGIEQDHIPIQYRLNTVQQELLTGNNDGRVVKFNASSITAVSGRFLLVNGLPLSNQLVDVVTKQGTVQLHTALDGRFYSEALSAGLHRFESTLCSGELYIPASNEFITELAPITCPAKEL